ARGAAAGCGARDGDGRPRGGDGGDERRVGRPCADPGTRAGSGRPRPRGAARAQPVPVVPEAGTVPDPGAAHRDSVPDPAGPARPPRATPAPTPGPALPGGTGTADPSGSSPEEPGLFDISGQIRKAINDFLGWIARTGLKPVMDALGKTVLATPDLTSNPQVQAIWTTSLVAANGIFVLFVIAGGFIVASRETLQSNYGLKEIAPRVVV